MRDRAHSSWRLAGPSESLHEADQTVMAHWDDCAEPCARRATCARRFFYHDALKFPRILSIPSLLVVSPHCKVDDLAAFIQNKPVLLITVLHVTARNKENKVSSSALYGADEPILNISTI